MYDKPDAPATSGGWLWNELHTTEPTKALSFYEKVVIPELFASARDFGRGGNEKHPVGEVRQDVWADAVALVRRAGGTDALRRRPPPKSNSQTETTGWYILNRFGGGQNGNLRGQRSFRS